MSSTPNLELQAATYKRQFSEANTRAKNLTSRLTALQTRFDGHVNYSIDLARIIESLSAGRDIVVPQTMPNMHYGMAVDALALRRALRREMLEALKTAKKAIRAWHGPNAWEIYDRSSPEMKAINAAVAKAEGRP